MRKISLLVGLVLALSLSARAQGLPKAEVFGGYSYLRVNPSSGSSFNLNGWEASVNVKPSSWFGVVGDFSGHYGSPFGPSANLHTYLFGPQINLPTPVVSPFVHAFFGGAHVSSSGASDSTFATALGGGIDLKVGPHLAWRVFQADDLVTRFGGSSQNNARVSAGIVLRF